MDLRSRQDYDITGIPCDEWALHTTCSDLSWHYNAAIGPTAFNGTKRVMLDYVVPRFHARLKAGEKFFNDMYSEKVTVTSAGAPYHLTTVANSCASPAFKAEYKSTGPWLLVPRQSVDGHGIQLPVITSALSDSDIYRARVEVSTDVWSKRGMSDTDIWESIAEYHQVLDLLSGHLEKLSSMLKRIETANQRNQLSRQLFKDVSGHYLMYRYGISPTIQDIRNILASLMKTTGKREKTTRSTLRLNASKTISGSIQPGVILRADWVNQISDAVTLRAMSLDEVDVSFANNLGLSTRGFLLLPWQLLSYSFVADWFANFSDYISATLPSFGYKQLGSCLVEERVIGNGYTINYTNVNTANYTMNTAPNGTVGIISVTKRRTPLEPAGLVIHNDFRFDKFTRVADALALFASRFGGLAKLGPFPNNSAFRDKKAYQRWADNAHL